MQIEGRPGLDDLVHRQHARVVTRDLRPELFMQIGHVRSGLAIARGLIDMAKDLGVDFAPLHAEIEVLQTTLDIKMQDMTRVYH